MAASNKANMDVRYCIRVAKFNALARGALRG